MTERDLDRIQSRSEFQAWVSAPKPQPIDPEDDVPMGRCEDAPCCGCCSADGSMVRGRRHGLGIDWRATEGGWPGDGSGMDDLADYNQMEAYDYGPDDY